GCRCRAPRTAGRSRGRARRGARVESARPPPRWPARAPGLTCRRPRRPGRPRGRRDRGGRAAVVSSRQASAVALAEPGELSYALAVALIALGYHLASRLAYVLYIGTMLRRQERTGYFTGRHGAEAGFRRFRRAAFLLMSNDAVSFVVMCLLSRGTLGQPSAAAIAAGVLLLLVGIATKLWAAATLGGDGGWRGAAESRRRRVPVDGTASRQEHHGRRGGDARGQIRLQAHARPDELRRRDRAPDRRWQRQSVRRRVRSEGADATEAHGGRPEGQARGRSERVVPVLLDGARIDPGRPARRQRPVLRRPQG